MNEVWKKGDLIEVILMDLSKAFGTKIIVYYKLNW